MTAPRTRATKATATKATAEKETETKSVTVALEKEKVTPGTVRHQEVPPVGAPMMVRSIYATNELMAALARQNNVDVSRIVGLKVEISAVIED